MEQSGFDFDEPVIVPLPAKPKHPICVLCYDGAHVVSVWPENSRLRPCRFASWLDALAGVLVPQNDHIIAKVRS